MYVKITSSEMVQRKNNDKKWQKCILCEHELCKNIYFVTKLFMRNSIPKNTRILTKTCKEFFFGLVSQQNAMCRIDIGK